jgi:1-acyl-sn-glycerol-3-phosphate acyltransferase
VSRYLDYSWRLIATGISFTTFGLGGLVLRLFVLPALNLLPGSRAEKTKRAQKSIHYSFRVFLGLMYRLGLLIYEIDGLERLNRPGQLIIANHPTLIDIVFLISRIPTALCIVKESLWNNPFMRGAVSNAGYISNADPVTMINDCVSRIQAGEILIVFPEGTRSIPGKPYKFTRGAANIALKSNAAVTPVFLTCHPSTLTKKSKWFQIPERSVRLTMHVGDDIKLDEFHNIKPSTVAVRHLNRHLQDYFNQKSEIYDQQLREQLKTTDY